MCGGIWRGNAKANASMGKLLSRALSDIHSHGEAMRRSFWNSAMVNSVFFLLFCLFCNNIAFIQHSTYDGGISVSNVSSLGLESTDAESKRISNFRNPQIWIISPRPNKKNAKANSFAYSLIARKTAKYPYPKGIFFAFHPVVVAVDD